MSDLLVASLRRPPHELPSASIPDGDALGGEDEPLALYLCYELCYRGLPEADESWEWSPSLLRLRARLEERFLAALFDLIGPPRPCGDVEAALHAILGGDGGPSLSAHLARDGTVEEFRELAVHRSAYQLKEADPHSWALPRLSGPAKAAMVAIQADEYGNGEEAEMHASLFARTLRALGLDDRYGAYLDAIPGVTLTTVNLMSLLGLHRRWRGALVGHLAIFEMASVGPNRAYGNALRRLGFGPEATRFYDVHVTADARHQEIAARELAGGLARAEPGLAGDIAFGARAIMAIEAEFARHLLGCWDAGRTSLRPVPWRHLWPGVPG